VDHLWLAQAVHRHSVHSPCQACTTEYDRLRGKVDGVEEDKPDAHSSVEDDLFPHCQESVPGLLVKVVQTGKWPVPGFESHFHSSEARTASAHDSADQLKVLSHA